MLSPQGDWDWGPWGARRPFQKAIGSVNLGPTRPDRPPPLPELAGFRGDGADRGLDGIQTPPQEGLIGSVIAVARAGGGIRAATGPNLTQKNATSHDWKSGRMVIPDLVLMERLGGAITRRVSSTNPIHQSKLGGTYTLTRWDRADSLALGAFPGWRR